SEMPVLGNREVQIAETGVLEQVAGHVAELSQRWRNHDRVALGIAAKKVEGCRGWAEWVPSVQRKRLRIASGVVSRVAGVSVSAKVRDRYRAGLEIRGLAIKRPTDGSCGRWAYG